jgi:gamma-glutamylcysteine synthetase
VTSQALQVIEEHFLSEFRERASRQQERRIGAELKFPFVTTDGSAVDRPTLAALWQYLLDRGWSADVDEASGNVIGARKPGEQNDTVASCETGYCKVEFSMAHVCDLHQLDAAVSELRQELHPFLSQHNSRLLCYGIHPVSPPSSALLMKKMRAGFWDKAFPSNHVIEPSEGDDVHLFTVNAGSHVHVSVSPEEAVRAVNVLTGFAGAQLALTAHSSVSAHEWPSGPYACVNEKFWDWWKPAQGRVGVPDRPFDSLRDYVDRIAGLRPVFAKRDGRPILLCRCYDRFRDYFAETEARGETVDSRACTLTPDPVDIATHNSCYWYTARISRYYTVENRVFDQQPADALLAPAALTLGLVEAADEAWEEIRTHTWQDLVESRDLACRHGMRWHIPSSDATSLVSRMLELADMGLSRRNLGESQYLSPLWERVRAKTCPADTIRQNVDRFGVRAILEKESF